MRTLYDYIKDLFNHFSGRLMINIVYMIVDGILSGAGIAMLVPLLSLTGLAGNEASANLPHVVTRLLSQWGMPASLTVILIIFIILIVSEACLAARISILNAEIVQGYTQHLRKSLYRDFLKAEWPCISGKEKSDIMSAFTNDITRIATGTAFFFNVVSQSFLAVFQLGLAFIMSIPLTLLVIFCAAAIFVLTKSGFRKSQTLGYQLGRINQEFIGQVAQQINVVRETKVYGIEDTEQKRFERITGAAQANQISFAVLQSDFGKWHKICAAWIISILFFISNCFFHINPAALMILVYIFARLWPLFASLQNNIQSIMAIAPSFLSLKTLMNDLEFHAEKTAADHSGHKKIAVTDAIRFENISFDYGEPDQFALKSITFEIKAKAVTAFVGKSGAGKTTIADLLLGLLRPFEGRILADGVPIDDQSIRTWRRGIGYVPQEPSLFNGTIRDNLLRFSPFVTQRDIDEALQLADAYDFVQRLPQGLDTPIGDNGIRLSGGQRQRIILARALIGKPEILVLDEATGSLDNESECEIRKSLKALSRDLTIIVIAHRLSTIRGADRIIVVEHGRVAEEGPFFELSNREGYLKRILRAGGYSA